MRISDPKELLDLLGRYAVAGAIVMIGSYGGTLTSGINPFRDVAAFFIVVGVISLQIFGVGLWLWVFAWSTQGLQQRVGAKHPDHPEKARVLAWAYTAIYAVAMASGGFLLFILAGHQSGVVT